MRTGIQITIQDTGRGIPDPIQSELFQEGFTHDKAGGTGRGLFHAKKTVAAWSGSISLASKAGVGTNVTITLPLAPAPSWFPPSIDLNGVEKILVLDDDGSIADFWRHRLPNWDILSFAEPETFSEWLSSNPIVPEEDGQNTLFLIDLRLGVNQPTGLDVIEEHGLAEKAILVTSDAGLESVQKRCSFLGTKLVAKTDIAAIPIIGDEWRSVPRGLPIASDSAVRSQKTST